VVNWPNSHADLERLREGLQAKALVQAQLWGQQQQGEAAAGGLPGLTIGTADSPGSSASSALPDSSLQKALQQGGLPQQDGAPSSSTTSAVLASDAAAAAPAGKELDLDAVLQQLAAGGQVDTGKRKDANEVLAKEGPALLRELVAAASPFPVKGLYRWGGQGWLQQCSGAVRWSGW
jgi:hypothetical protein